MATRDRRDSRGGSFGRGDARKSYADREDDRRRRDDRDDRDRRPLRDERRGGPDGVWRRDEVDRRGPAPARRESTISQPVPPTPTIDRDQVCPMLVRCFWNLGGHHREADFARDLPTAEVQIHTWPDATLRELAELLKNVGNEGGQAARRRTASMAFSVVFPDRSGRFMLREVGRVFSVANGRKDDGERSLASLNFKAGDFIDIAIFGGAQPNAGPGGRRFPEPRGGPGPRVEREREPRGGMFGAGLRDGPRRDGPMRTGPPRDRAEPRREWKDEPRRPRDDPRHDEAPAARRGRGNSRDRDEPRRDRERSRDRDGSRDRGRGERARKFEE